MPNVLSPRKRKAAIAKAVATKRTQKEEAAREAAMASSGSAWLETSVQKERAEIDKPLADASPQTILVLASMWRSSCLEEILKGHDKEQVTPCMAFKAKNVKGLPQGFIFQLMCAQYGTEKPAWRSG
eukprot:3347714-Amphidinium_carterae.1